MTTSTHRNIELVTAALLAGGADPARVGRLRVLPEAVHTAALAAAALGIEVGQIANSLVFEAVTGGVGAPLLVLTSGAHRVDLVVVAAAAGVDALRRAKPDMVRAATGQVIGGVAPVGHPEPLRTLVDRDLERYDEVWASGGIPQSVFPTTYAELLVVTGGTPVTVA